MKKIVSSIINLPRSITGYLRATFSELRKMEWLTLGQVVRYALIVLIVSAVLTVVILAMDTAFSTARNYLLQL